MNPNLKASISILAVAAALTLSAGQASASASASCMETTQTQVAMPAPADSSAFRGRSADKNIVGTWFVSYFSDGVPTGQAFIQWHSDGTEWENINGALAAVCMGSWMKVDSDHVSRNHYGWIFADGVLTGYFNQTELTEVSQHGTYHGTTDFKQYDLTGNLLGEFQGTSKAVYIAP